MTGVSPKSRAIVGAVATVGTLILVLVLTGVFPLLPAQTAGVGEGCLSCRDGQFIAGNPVLGTCPSGGTFASAGCSAGEFVYTLTVESSFATFGQVLFHIEASNGTVYVAIGGESGFSILSSTGAVVAQYPAANGLMSMKSGWSYAVGITATTPLTSLYAVLVDMGAPNPHGQGYTFVDVSTGNYTGSSSVMLP